MFPILRRIASWAIGRRTPPSRHPPFPILGISADVDQGILSRNPIDVAQRLAAMPLFVREVYLLRTVDKMPIDEIGQRLAISRRRVRRHLRRAITILASDRPVNP